MDRSTGNTYNVSKEQNTPGIERRRFRPYPEYKDSGVGWLGKIPAHWDITRIKEQFCIVNGSTPSSSDPSFWDGDIVWVTPDDLGELHVSQLGDSSRKITEEGYKSCGTSIVPKGSIVVSTRAPIGYVAIATTNLCTNQGCKSLVPKRPLSTGFFYYQLSSAKNELKSRGEGSTFKEISKDKLGLIIFTKPPEPDQHSIAFFLDRETAKIDVLIEKKERLIDLLQEKRTALITQAVTKGLDPTVPMKDSGVEWLGKIPAYWEACRVKSLTKEHKQGFYTEQPYIVEGVKLARISDIDDRANVHFNNMPYVGIDAKDECIFRLSEGDILFARSGTIGRFGIVCGAERAVFASYLIRFRFSRVHVEFLRYAFGSKYFRDSLVSSLHGGANQNVHAENIKALTIALPPRDEQLKITAYLFRETAKIDTLVAEIQDAINHLREYRTALIAAAVIGKIDLRKELASR